MQSVALRYALAPAGILLVALVYVSPAGPLLSLTGLFVIAVLAAAWFGGAGPGLLAAVLATLTQSQLAAPSYPLLGGFLDLPRGITFCAAGLAVGWGSSRRARVLRDQERYARAMEASDAGLWDWIVDQNTIYVSPRLLEIYGFPPGTTFAGRDDLFARIPFHPDDRPLLQRAFAEHLGGKTARYETQARLIRDGRTRWLHIIGVAAPDRSGQVRWTGTVRDVTERKRAEEALRESEERYALAMEAAGDGHTDWNLQSGEHYISPSLLRICGYAPGTTFRDRAEWVRRFPFHPEDRPKWEQAIAAHFAGRESNFKMELRLVVDGKVRWAAFHFVSTRDAAGTPIRWTGSIADITRYKLTEEALRVSEERFARAVAGSYSGVWDVDFVGRSVYFSARTRELYGLPPGPDVVPMDGWFEALPLHPEDRPKRTAAVEAHLSGMAPVYEGEFRLLQPDGVYRWRHVHGVCVRDADGRPLRMAGSITDVDARRRAEDALRESERRYEFAMAASESGYWDWDVLADTYFVSPRAFELGGYAPGTKWVDRDEYRANINMHPEDFARWEAAREALFTGTGERISMQARYIVRGETRWHLLHAICRRDDTGKVIRWTGSTTDITERKLAEEALRESEQRYELAMAASESGYWDWHVPTDRYMASRRAYEMGGYDIEWTSREHFRSRINMHPEDFAKWEAAREALFAGTGERLAMEVRYIVRGETRWHSLQAICKRDDTGKVVRWTGSTTDVTQRKRAEEGLRAMERKLRLAQRLEAMGTLAGGIAHDFNNILGGVLGYGEMALRDAPKGSRLARDLEKIMVAGERGRALVDRVLAFSRSAVGERVPVHVERVVREVLDLVSAKLPSGVTVDARLRAGPAAVLGEATQMHQVVANLATNAIQAMPAGGTLRVDLAIEHVDVPRAATIGARAPGEYVVLTVADTGAGIAPAILDRIFDPFFTTKEVGRGTGLGLSLVHGIVTQQGGAIDVASTLGSGSTFTVYLPRFGNADEPAGEKESALPRGDGQRVLIVDDEEPLVELATRTLSELGYVPVGFTSSAAALAAFRADPRNFDALVTDERMPELSGSALIQEVRGMRRSMPVVLMSGYLEATAGDADEVLQKPLSARDLAASLARVLLSRNQRRDG